MMTKGLIETYFERLPIKDKSKIVSLQEGNTPLIRLINLEKELQQDIKIYAKHEGLNPSASFKDRGMTVAVTHANEKGVKALICASTGNTAAAASAYGARAGMKVFIVIPEGKIALGKLAQSLIHGAHVIQIKGNFDEGLSLVKHMAEKLSIELVNSINPYRLQGQKTVAFEIIDELGFVPDYHYLPVGNAGNISATWMGYTEYLKEGLIKTRPIMVGYQASGAAPFIKGAPIDNPETVASAIRIGHPQSWDLAQNAKDQSEGWFDALPDEKILEAQKMLAQKDGVFCEPASAISVGGLVHDIKRGKIPAGSTVVCTLTGHGLKDPDVAIGQCQTNLMSVDCTDEAIEKAISQFLD